MHDDDGSLRLVPELDVSQVDVSIDFYALLGFSASYRRPEEGFASSSEAAFTSCSRRQSAGTPVSNGPARAPVRSGLNFQLEVEDVRAIYDEIRGAGHPPLVELEERWYRVDAHEAGNLQFVVADPYGYLWRPFEDLGVR